jgi:hypothetical protein
VDASRPRSVSVATAESDGDPNAQTPTAFEKIGDEFYVDEIEMTQEQLVDYQLTQSNFVAAVERGTPLPSIRAWLYDSTTSYYADAGVRTLRFLGSLTCLRPTSDGSAGDG